MSDGSTGAAGASRLRELPSVDALLRHPAVARLEEEFAREELVCCVRAVLDQARRELRAGGAPPASMPALALRIRAALHARARPTLRRVINATGIVLHTGLGRAPLAAEAIDAIAEVAAGYCNLELDLATGERGDRHDHLRPLLCELTGGEDALVVNNNAAATFLALHTLARGRGVLVSRGQLVEIGGSYRMPDIMAAAGCRMIEVGTTNRTHLSDYRRAIDDDTSVLLRVHTSNYRITGFTACPTLEQLVELARDTSRSRPDRPRLIVIDDLGSGWMGPPGGERASGPEPPAAALWDEPTVRGSVRDGADLTLFSGDKLLGGPQAGILVGRAAAIAAIRGSPLSRIVRPDKLTLAALEATLRLYREPAALPARLPVHRMLHATAARLEEVARRLAQGMTQHLRDATVDCRPDQSFAGGGTLPTIPFDTWVVCVRHARHSAQSLGGALRSRDVPIVCRLHDDALVFDCRTLRDEDAAAIPPAVADAVRDMDGPEPLTRPAAPVVSTAGPHSRAGPS